MLRTETLVGAGWLRGSGDITSSIHPSRPTTHGACCPLLLMSQFFRNLRLALSAIWQQSHTLNSLCGGFCLGFWCPDYTWLNAPTLYPAWCPAPGEKKDSDTMMYRPQRWLYNILGRVDDHWSWTLNVVLPVVYRVWIWWNQGFLPTYMKTDVLKLFCLPLWSWSSAFRSQWNATTS